MMERKKVGFTYEVTQISPSGVVIAHEKVHNLMPNEGIKHIIDILFNNGTQETWYIGCYTNQYTPLATDTAATFTGNAGEIDSYTAAARPKFTPIVSEDGLSVTNTGSEAEFVFNAISNVKGLFISSSSEKMGVGGILLSAALLTTAKAMEVDGILRVNAGFTFSST